jgi:hypothetical protein
LFSAYINSREPNGLGYFGELGVDLGLVVGDLRLLSLHFFDERKQWMLAICVWFPPPGGGRSD